MDNEKLQEFSIIMQDRIRSVGKAWWYALFAALLVSIPAYYILKASFANLIVSNHKFPAFIYQVQEKQPLEVIDKKVFKLEDKAYSGYIKIKNINLEYGSQDQAYTAVFYTTGGTEVNRVSSTAYILPSSVKIIVIPRFSSDKEPTELKVLLSDTKFIHIPPNRPAPNFELQRVSMQQIDNQFVVSAAIKNKTPFTIREVGLPVLLYDRNNQIVGANYTNINDLVYQETRSFQFTWPSNPSAVRAEILPEMNIFDNGIYILPPGSSQFDSVPTSNP